MKLSSLASLSVLMVTVGLGLASHAATQADLLKCKVSFSDSSLSSPTANDILVSPFVTSMDTLAVLSGAGRAAREVGQLEIQLSYRVAVNRLEGRITAHPQYMDRFPVALDFVPQGSSLVAEFTNLKRQDGRLTPNPVPLSGQVICVPTQKPFAFVARDMYSAPNVLVPGEQELFGRSLDDQLFVHQYCVQGNSNEAYAALKASPEFLKKDKLSLSANGDLTYSLDTFVCDVQGQDDEGCVQGHQVKDAISVTVPSCR